MLRNVGSNWVVTLVAIAATYVLTPFVIHTLGKEGYGTWTLITTTTGFISLLTLGVPMACVRYLAEHIAQRDTAKINEAIGSCAALYLILGATAVATGAVLGLLLIPLYETPAGPSNEAGLAFAVMVLTVSAGFIGYLPEGIMFAHHDFVPRNLIRVAGVLMRLTLTAVLLAMSASLVVLALVQAAVVAFDFATSWFFVHRRYPGVRISLANFHRPMVRQIFSFSLFVLLLQAGSRLSFEADALVIGAFLGVGSIPYYVVPNSLIVYLMEFVVAIAAVVAPMATKLHTEGRTEALRDVFLKWSKVALSLSMMAGLFLIVFGPRFLGWWIDPSFEGPGGEVLQILMISSLIFLPVRGVALPVLIGIGKPKAATLAFLAAGLLNIALSVALIQPFGLRGAAFGTAIPNVLFALFVLVHACRELRTSVLSYVRYVVPRAALGAMPVLALLLWFKFALRVETFPGLVGAGCAMVFLFGLTWIFFVYRDDPYVDVRPHLARLRAWSKA